MLPRNIKSRPNQNYLKSIDELLIINNKNPFPDLQEKTLGKVKKGPIENFFKEHKKKKNFDH